MFFHFFSLFSVCEIPALFQCSCHFFVIFIPTDLFPSLFSFFLPSDSFQYFYIISSCPMSCSSPLRIGWSMGKLFEVRCTEPLLRHKTFWLSMIVSQEKTTDTIRYSWWMQNLIIWLIVTLFNPDREFPIRQECPSLSALYLYGTAVL